MTVKFYRQCVLQKKDIRKTAFLPEQFAKINKYIKIKEDDGWQVVSVGIRLPDYLVDELERDHLDQRKASDI
jgi:hypothetical protein